jgi:hypothetical protein
MKRRTFSDRELRDLSMKADIYDYQIVVDLTRYALVQQRTIAKLRKALEPFGRLNPKHADGGFDVHIVRARKLTAPRAKRGAR